MLGTRTALVGLAIIAMLATAPVTVADDVADMKETIKSLQARLEKMEREQANTVHKEEMAKMMKEILDDAKAQPALPKWMENLKFYGDLRLRFESRHRSWRSFDGSQYDNDGYRNRARYRFRFGLKKTWWDKQMEIGARLATGSSESDSANVTFGGRFGKAPIMLDLLYVKYAPKWLEGLVITGGKMKKPWASATPLLWDGDINPEGFHVKYTAPFCGPVKPYAAAGYWIWQLDSPDRWGMETDKDITFWTWELGADWEITKDVKLFAGATWYNIFRNWDASLGQYQGRYGDWVNPAGGGNAAASILELTASLSWKMAFLPKPIQKWKVWASWVNNCADDYNWKYAYTAGVWTDPGIHNELDDQQNAYSVGMKVGKNKKKGDFSVGYEYRYIEYAAVPSIDGFGWNDSDFACAGGTTNVQGHIIGGKYNIDDFLTIGGKVIVTQPITSNVPSYEDGEHHDEDSTVLVQVDMVWKF